MIDLEQSSLDNAQYLRREMIEISPVPLEVSNNELEGLVCKGCPWQEMKYIPMILKHVNVSRKKKMSSSNSIAENWSSYNKIIMKKSKEFNELKFSKLITCIFLKVCMHAVSWFFECRKLKKARKIFNTWFFNNAINVQLNQSGEIHKVFHTEDLAALLKVDDLDSFLMNL